MHNVDEPSEQDVINLDGFNDDSLDNNTDDCLEEGESQPGGDSINK